MQDGLVERYIFYIIQNEHEDAFFILASLVLSEITRLQRCHSFLRKNIRKYIDINFVTSKNSLLPASHIHIGN